MNHILFFCKTVLCAKQIRRFIFIDRSKRDLKIILQLKMLLKSLKML
jgi:hypothetical protein